MVIVAQKWLDKNYPLSQRTTVETIVGPDNSGHNNSSLYGELDLTGFTNLKVVKMVRNLITSINLTGCPHLTHLDLSRNRHLSEIDLKNSHNLTYLDLSEVNDAKVDISHLTKLTFFKCENIEAMFWWYLQQNPTKNLPSWKKFLDCFKNKDGTNWKLSKLPTLELIWQWEAGKWGQPEQYWNILKEWTWTDSDGKKEKLFDLASKQLIFTNFWTKENEYKQVIKQLSEIEKSHEELTTKLSEHETNLTNTRSLLDKSSNELTQKEQELTNLKITLEKAHENYQEQIKLKEEQISIQQAEITAKTEELADLKEQFGVKDETLKNKEQKILTRHQEIVTSNRELDKLKADYQDQQNKIIELESQLTALALGSSVLVNQVEDLTNQLNTSQLAEQSAKLEKEIKENLLVNKENELKDRDNQISEQEAKLNSYQQIIRQSEANLSKAQDIILSKAESLEQLEQEKDSLTEELEQAEENITNLETTLITSQQKINDLETRIKELASDNSNQEELDKLKQQLAQEKNNNVQQITQLQAELTKLKNNEAQLSLKIKNLTTKQEKVQVEVKSPSLWSKVKTPFLIFSGIVIIIFAIQWIGNKFTK